MKKRTFKDFYKQDINRVFFNEDEFSERVNIEGKEVLVNIDTEAFSDYNSKNGGEGLFFNGFLFYVKKEDMPFIPRPGKGMMFNDEYLYISDVKEPPGLYSITLEVRGS